MIVGFGIKFISAERKSVPKGRVDINSSPKILSVTKSKMGFLKKGNPLNIEFEFTTKYEPKIGEIKIAGNVLFTGKKMKDILKTWKKEKKVPGEVDKEVKNFLFRKCLTIGVNLSENMQLPPPLMFPKLVSKKTENLSYIG